MKLGDLFANQKRLFDVLNSSERKKYYRLLGLHFFGTLIELFGILILYLLLLVVLDFQSFEPIYTKFLGSPIPSETEIILSLVFAYLIKTIFFLYVGKLQLKSLFNLSRCITFRTFAHTFDIGLLNQKQQKSADRISEVSQVANMLPYVVLLPSVLVISELVFVVLAIIIMLLYSPLLVLVICLALIPQSILLVWWGRRKLARIGTEITMGGADQNHLIENTLYGYAEIKLWNLRSFFSQRFESLTDKLYSKRIEAQWIGSVAPQRLMEVLTVVALAVIALFLKSMGDGTTINGVLALFAAIAFRLLPSFNRIVGSTNTFNTYSNMLEFVSESETMDTNIKVNDNIGCYKSLKIKNIYFYFTLNTPILENFSLEINTGDFIGITGESGIGKTTLLNIILGFYEPIEGAILVNDLPLSENIETWHSKLGLVRQDAYVLPGTIRNNIAFGQEVVDEEKLISVLEQVKLDKWVNELPSGVETVIGDHGALVSGGQKQRIAIARALYRNPEVLILDEVTTALDDKNKQVIWDIISELNKVGTTIVMVSHDRSGLANVNKHVDLTLV